MVYCKNCGHALDFHATACTSCGFATGTGQRFCPACGNETMMGAAICTHCGMALMNEQKSKIAAGLLGIFLGGFGVHNFYLGYTQNAIIQLSMSLVGIFLAFCTFFSVFLTMGAGIWGLVEGIFILTGKISTDAKGIPLRE